METSVYRTEWHGLEAWALTNADTSVVMVPCMGAKIVSLVDLRAQTEWLVGPGNRIVKPVEYGAVFTDQDMAGWDEMFPTIIRCPYPAQGAHHDAILPDHGEAWALPWSFIQSEEDTLTVSMEGRSLPYCLTRVADFPQPSTLRLRYILQNLGAEPLPYLWAAHPQLTTGMDGQVILPAEVTRVMNTIPESWGWGPPETHFDWPEAQGVDGSPLRLDLIGPPSHHKARKFYSLPDVHPAWAAVLRRQTGHWIRFEWDPLELPYLGVWIDEGALSAESVVALEPTSAYYDDLGLAYSKGLLKTLQVGETHHWTLQIRMGMDAQPRP